MKGMGKRLIDPVRDMTARRSRMSVAGDMFRVVALSRRPSPLPPEVKLNQIRYPVTGELDLQVQM
jgi:hypothetical protein